MISSMANRNTHIMCSKSHDCYVATLYTVQNNDEDHKSFTPLLKIWLDHTGNIGHSEKNNCTVYQSDITLLKQYLAKYILKEYESKRHWLGPLIDAAQKFSEDHLEIIAFFIQHDQLKSLEFYHLRQFIEIIIKTPLRDRVLRCEHFDTLIDYISYGHHEKSVKLALYRSYETSMRWMNKYDPRSDMIICRSFDDVNLICRLIDTPIKIGLFEDIPMKHSILFLRWLQKRYKPLLIATSIERSISYNGSLYTPMWVNTMRMASQLSSTKAYVFEKYFQKVNMNVKQLHDELIRINTIAQRTQIQNRTYSYSKSEMLSEVTVDHLDFKLVKNSMELYMWGDMLHNCLFGFEERIVLKRCLIIGVFIENELTYAIEFDGRVILQAYGKYNTRIPEDTMSSIKRWASDTSRYLKDYSLDESGNNFRMLNQYQVIAVEDQNDETLLEELYLDEDIDMFEEEEKKNSAYAYTYEISNLVEPMIVWLKKYYKADDKVYDVYTRQDKIIIATEHSKDTVFTQIQNMKMDAHVPRIDTSYSIIDILDMIEISN